MRGIFFSNKVTAYHILRMGFYEYIIYYT